MIVNRSGRHVASPGQIRWKRGCTKVPAATGCAAIVRVRTEAQFASRSRVGDRLSTAVCVAFGGVDKIERVFQNGLEVRAANSSPHVTPPVIVNDGTRPSAPLIPSPLTRSTPSAQQAAPSSPRARMSGPRPEPDRRLQDATDRELRDRLGHDKGSVAALGGEQDRPRGQHRVFRRNLRQRNELGLHGGQGCDPVHYWSCGNVARICTGERRRALGFHSMVEDRFPDEPLRSVVQNDLRSELVSPLVAWLVHEDCTAHGQVFEGPRQGSLRGLQGFWARDMTPASLTATGTRSTILTA